MSYTQLMKWNKLIDEVMSVIEVIIEIIDFVFDLMVDPKVVKMVTLICKIGLVYQGGFKTLSGFVGMWLLNKIVSNLVRI